MNEITIAENLCRAAGAVALKYFLRGEVKQKPNDGGPLSDGDIAADAVICEGLQQSFPDDVIISEESCEEHREAPSSGRVWFVDPIDGTADYVRGGNDYAVMIGLAIDGQPALGVVYQPATNICWRAVNGIAERVDADGVVTTLKVNSSPENSPRILISRNHPSPKVNAILAKYDFSEVIQLGSVGLKLVRIAEGGADLYINPSRRLKLWDTCGPVAILRAAGGCVEAFGKQLITWEKCVEHGTGLIFATSSSLHFAHKILDG